MAKKTAKKTTAKKTTAKKVTTKKVSKDVNKNVKAKNIKIDKNKARKILKPLAYVLVLLLLLMFADYFVQYLNNDASIAVIDGKRISRKEYINKLEEVYGDQIAEALVDEEIIRQLGEKEGITVTEADIDEEYNEIVQQMGGEEALNQTLTMYNMSMEDLKEQIKNELTLEGIIAPTLEYTDEDLGNFFEQYKEMIYEDTSEITFEEKRDEIEKYYIKQQVSEERASTLEKFKSDLNIQINTPSEREERGYEFFKATRNVISNLFGGE